MTVCKRVLYSGRVQGVGFRYTAHGLAQGYDVAGYVRNLPGGEVVLVNHVSAESGPRAAFEKWLGRQTRHLGWRPEFPWARIADWCAGRSDIEIAERRPVGPFGWFMLVRLRKRSSSRFNA